MNTTTLLSVLERFFYKITSGRFILTVICGATFSYLACSGKLDAKDALTIIAIVVTFYFTKSTTAKNGNGNENGNNNGNGNGN